MNKCKNCGENCRKNKCGICRSKEKLTLPCKYCQKNTKYNRGHQAEVHKKGGPICKKCMHKMASKRLKAYKKSLTPQQRQQQSVYGRSCVKADMGQTVRKQWATIKSNTKKYQQFCQDRSDRMKKVWQEYPDSTRNYIIKQLASSHGKGRSKVSDDLKQMMIDNNVYDNFISEEVFHGFIPDEINHDLKIIVEMFGDLYHCNPKKYKDPNIYLKSIGRTVKEQWKRDRIRLACFYKHGYTVIIVWEKDFRNDPVKQIERIKDEIDKKRSLTRVV